MQIMLVKRRLWSATYSITFEMRLQFLLAAMLPMPVCTAAEMPRNCYRCKCKWLSLGPRHHIARCSYVRSNAGWQPAWSSTRNQRKKSKEERRKKRTGLHAQTSRIWSSVGGAVRRREGSPRRKMRPDLVNRLVFVRCFPTRGRVTFSSAAAAAASVWTRPAGAGHIFASLHAPQSVNYRFARVRTTQIGC